jgi:hypothetical protein
MEYIARIELGLTSEVFYSSTWYDWSLWMHKIHHDRKKRNEDHEVIIEMFRTSLSFYYNCNKGSENPEISREDFWRLSYDKPKEEVEVALSEEEKAEKLSEAVKRLESKSKFKKRG